MKLLKSMLLMLALLVCFSCLGCKDVKDPSKNPSNGTDESQPDGASHSFESAEALAGAAVFGKCFPSQTVYAPQLGGADLPLQNREGFSNITVFESELYGLPWVWYHCVRGETDVTVKMTYLSCVEGVDAGAAATMPCDQVLRSISPNAVNVDNFENYASYERVSEVRLMLADGEVSALKYELVGRKEIFVSFVCGEVFVSVAADASALTEDFWQQFSLRVVS